MLPQRRPGGASGSRCWPSSLVSARPSCACVRASTVVSAALLRPHSLMRKPASYKLGPLCLDLRRRAGVRPAKFSKPRQTFPKKFLAANLWPRVTDRIAVNNRARGQRTEKKPAGRQQRRQTRKGISVRLANSQMTTLTGSVFQTSSPDTTSMLCPSQVVVTRFFSSPLE